MSDAMDTKTAQEYWVSSDELLLAGARALDDGEQQRGIDLLSKAFEHRSFAAILFQKERDTLAAELVALRAGLPRWRTEDGERYRLKIGREWLGTVSNHKGDWRARSEAHTATYDDRNEAMRAIEAGIGLPPCEVEGE